jgi:CheY-like chemotaxis protein
MRILLVEDNVDLCQSMQTLLTLCGHEVQCSLRSAGALAALRAGTDADIVISDYYLPDMNGVELIGKLRELQPELPAILLTGSREDGIVQAARRLHDVRVLHKPIEIEALESCIAQLCSSAPTGDNVDSRTAVPR